MSTLISVMDTVNFIATGSGSSEAGDSLSSSGSSGGSAETGLDLAKLVLTLLSSIIDTMS